MNFLEIISRSSCTLSTFGYVYVIHILSFPPSLSPSLSLSCFLLLPLSRACSLSLSARDFDVQHTAAGLGKEMVGGSYIPSQLVKKCMQYVNK